MGTGKVSTWYRLTVPRFFPLLSLDLPLGNTLSRIAPANNLYFDYEALEISRNYIPWHEFVFFGVFCPLTGRGPVPAVAKNAVWGRETKFGRNMWCSKRARRH